MVMSIATDSERVDLLLALALTFGEAGGVSHVTANSSEVTREEGEQDASDARTSLDVLSALSATERQAVVRRASWYTRLAPQKQREWLACILSRTRISEGASHLDEHVHPSHVVAVLGDEPPRVQELVVTHLPHALASAVASELGLAGDDEPAQIGARSSGRDETSARARGVSGSRKLLGAPIDAADETTRNDEVTTGGASLPSPEVTSIVRREFLAHFVTPGELPRMTPLEELSGVELARLIRLLGVRETAVACRGIASVEAVASFLRRFLVQDARAIAAHIASLSEVDARRVAFAEQVVHESLLAEPEPGGMLDRIGLRLLASALAGDEDAPRLRYAAQKLPLEIARWLEVATRDALAATATQDRGTREVLVSIAQTIETVAAGLGHRHRPRPPSKRRGAAVAQEQNHVREASEL